MKYEKSKFLAQYGRDEHADEYMQLHHNIELRKSVARNPSLSKDRIDRIMRDPDWSVRLALVSDNPSIDESHLKHLSRDSSIMVRSAVANSTSSEDTLSMLSRDPMQHVRMNVAKNPNINQEHVDLLSRDSSAAVVSSLLDNLKTRKKN